MGSKALTLTVVVLVLALTACSASNAVPDDQQELEDTRQVKPKSAGPHQTDIPNFDSATSVPGTDYQITDDGFLIYGGDVVIKCESVWYEDDDLKFADPDIREKERQARKEAYEEQVKVCTEAGFPPDEAPR